MNVSAISSLSQRAEDFTALHNTLQAGNLAAAQSAFAAFQQDVQKTAQLAGPASLFGPGTQASKDLQNLGNALKSANKPRQNIAGVSDISIWIFLADLIKPMLSLEAVDLI